MADEPEVQEEPVDTSTLPEGMRPEPPPEPEPVQSSFDPAEIAALREELAAIKAAQSQPAPEPPAEPEDDFDAAFWENPRAVIDKVKEDIRKEVREEYQKDQEARSFWADFNRENPNLASHTHIVQAVMNNHWSDVKDLSGKAARDKVAELTKEEIMGIGIRPQAQPDETTTLEGASYDNVTPIPQSQSDGPKSLTETLRLRQQQKAGTKA